jgi:hypothetical protein
MTKYEEKKKEQNEEKKRSKKNAHKRRERGEIGRPPDCRGQPHKR